MTERPLTQTQRDCLRYMIGRPCGLDRFNVSGSQAIFYGKVFLVRSVLAMAKKRLLRISHDSMSDYWVEITKAGIAALGEKEQSR